MQQCIAFGPVAYIGGAVDMTEWSDVYKAATPCSGKFFCFFNGDIRIVAAGYGDGRKGEGLETRKGRTK